MLQGLGLFVIPVLSGNLLLIDLNLGARKIRCLMI